MTSFIGREKTVAAVHDALRQSRLVTLTGFGGMGKSRLALAVFDELRGRFEDGEWWADLSSLPAGSPVDERVFAAVGGQNQTDAPVREILIEHLTDQHSLLVLDNCEHLAAQVLDLLTPLLAAAPRLHVLATSREALGRSGERVVAVPPLRVPLAGKRPDAFEVGQFESVQLFADRATAVRPDFAVTDENAGTIAQLTAALEGSPLGIELAASRVRSLGVSEILERLDDSLAFLRRQDPAIPARQSSLRALIQTSWDLCSPQEQLVWTRAAVFSGGFSLPAAESVCGGRGVEARAVVDLIDQLVAKSIVVVEESAGRSRFRLLETIRQFGDERLEGEDRHLTLRAHRDFYHDLARWALERWTTPEQTVAMETLGQEVVNLEHALAWSFATAGEEEIGVAMVHELRFHWAQCGHLRAGRGWLRYALDVPDLSPVSRGSILWLSAWVALVQGEREAAAEYLADADSVLAETVPGDRVADSGRDSAIAHTTLMRGTLALFTSQLEDAIELFSAAIDQLRELDERGGFLLGSMELVIALSHAGRSEEAQAVAAKALETSESAGETWGRAQTLWAMGFDRWVSGDLASADDLATRALDLRLTFNLVGTALDLELLAWIASSAGERERAARLLGAAQSMWVRLGTRIGAFGEEFERHSRTCEDSLRSALPRRRLEELIREGAERDPRDLVHTRSRESSRRPKGAALTRRETQVAALVADGMSNREIADHLVLSPRTVDGHVENILAKLHLKSRTQVAAWVLRSGAETEV